MEKPSQTFLELSAWQFSLGRVQQAVLLGTALVFKGILVCTCPPALIRAARDVAGALVEAVRAHKERLGGQWIKRYRLQAAQAR